MKIPKRRRREGKTDYRKRINLLKGRMPRVIFRKTNQYIIGQYVTSKEAKDKVEIGITSKNLLDFGWPKEFLGSLKSIPAAYLTGLALGKKIMDKKLESPIMDIGMIGAINKSKVFAFIKGLIDAGVKIKCSKENFPEEERLSGKSLKKDFSERFKEIKSKIEKQ
jgi:large subunit ribosomal protein L18